jgi:hypothetical protein
MPDGYKGQVKNAKIDEICNQTLEVIDPFLPITYEITGLEPCANYRIRVIAVTPNGQESESTLHEDGVENDGKLILHPYMCIGDRYV